MSLIDLIECTVDTEFLVFSGNTGDVDFTVVSFTALSGSEKKELSITRFIILLLVLLVSPDTTGPPIRLAPGRNE